MTSTRPSPSTREPVPFASATLRDNRHVCAFFRSSEEEFRWFLPFVRDGFSRGDRHVRFVQREPGRTLDQLRAEGIDVDAARRRHQLEVFNADDTYLKGGRFNGDMMIETLLELLEQGPRLGFPMTRLIAHAEHMLYDSGAALEFLEYESRLNNVLPQYSDVVICSYDLDKVTAGMAMDILRTHPVAVIDGGVQENPYFVAPGELLREFAARRANEKERTPQPVA
jgi:DcmR-like sensory protein